MEYRDQVSLQCRLQKKCYNIASLFSGSSLGTWRTANTFLLTSLPGELIWTYFMHMKRFCQGIKHDNTVLKVSCTIMFLLHVSFTQPIRQMSAPSMMSFCCCHRIVFLYCCPDCMSCLTHLSSIGWAAWAFWAAVKKYSLNMQNHSLIQLWKCRKHDTSYAVSIQSWSISIYCKSSIKPRGLIIFMVHYHWVQIERGLKSRLKKT